MKYLALLLVAVGLTTVTGCDRNKPVRDIIEDLVPNQSVVFIMNQGYNPDNQRYYKVTRISQEEYARY